MTSCIYRIGWFFMKKIYIVLCIILCTLMIGCSKKSDKPPEQMSKTLNQGFNANAKIKFGDIEAEAIFDKSNENSCMVEFSQPKVLNSLKLIFDGESINVSYLGLNLELNENSALTKTVVSAIINAIDSSVKDSGVRVSKENNAIIIDGKNENGEFNVKLDKKNGNIISIDIPALNIKCNFENFKFK